MKFSIFVPSVLVAIAIVFGIAQPIVWRILFQSDPPDDVVTVSVTLTLLLALLSIGISAFGLGAYRIMRDQIQSESVEMAKAVVEEARVQACRNSASLVNRIASLRWSDYQMSKQMPNFKAWSDSFLNDAIELADHAYILCIEGLDVSTRENELLICEIASKLVWYLAERGKSEDRNVALGIAVYLDEKIIRYGDEARREWIGALTFTRSRYSDLQKAELAVTGETPLPK